MSQHSSTALAKGSTIKDVTNVTDVTDVTDVTIKDVTEKETT